MSRIYDALKRVERDRSRGGSATTEAVSRTERAFDPVNEEYRRLRASLILSAGVGELHTILVAAPRHGEGTSRVALGLACSLASEEGARVLLLEGNLRTPSLGRLAGTGGAPGVADYLLGRTDPESLLLPIPDLNLTLVQAGRDTVKIDCDAVAHLAAELSARFDFTIIDAPPVNQYADTAMLGARVDGVILVVEADSTPVADAEMAKRTLERVGARILGVVLNRKRTYTPAWLQNVL